MPKPSAVVAAPSAPAPAESAAPEAPAPSAPEPAAPAASASAKPPEPAEPAAPAAPPPVEVKNIGMHIGGGPYDAVTKGPFKRSMEPHFPALALCWAAIGDAAAKGDVSLDLRVEKDGGKAKVTKVKSMLGDEAFKTCIVNVIDAVDFEKPKGGTTNVSYSLRFAPKKGDAP